jgi:DNA invertase Pin-like site-specific DNA recombinase
MTGPKPLRAAIYARISMDRTGEGLGVQRQSDDCLALAKKRGLTVVATLSDNDISAYSGKRRAGYEALLGMIRSGEIDVVIAWHTDRLHRSVRDLETYIEACEHHRTSTLTVRAGELDLSSAAGRMLARMLGSVARHESEQKGERVRRARRQAAERGKAHGPLGYGYDDRQQLILREAAIIREVAERILDGETLYGIAADLNERGVPTPGAGVWRWQHVRRAATERGTSVGLTDAQGDLIAALLTAESHTNRSARALLTEADFNLDEEGKALLLDQLTGDDVIGEGPVARLLDAAGVRPPITTWRAANLRQMVSRGAVCGWRDFDPGKRGGGPMVARGEWQPIIDKETVERLRALLNAPGRKRSGVNPKFLLTGTLVCGDCGNRLTGTTDNRQSRGGGRRYSCNSIPGTDRCGGLTIVAAPVEAMVAESVLRALSDAGIRSGRKRLHSTDAISAATAALDALDRELVDWRADLSAGRTDRATFMDAQDGIVERRRVHEAVMSTVSPSVTSALAGVPVDRRQVETWWRDVDTERRRRVVRALIERIVVSKAQAGGGNRFNATRVGLPVWRA